jgi:hypothetical protein
MKTFAAFRDEGAPGKIGPERSNTQARGARFISLAKEWDKPNYERELRDFIPFRPSCLSLISSFRVKYSCNDAE